MEASIPCLGFAFGWTPGIDPKLGAILTRSANSISLQCGVWLLAIYALGLGVSFLRTAILTDAIAARNLTIGRAGQVPHRLVAGVMVLIGLAMLTGQMPRMVFWLLARLPGVNFTLR